MSTSCMNWLISLLLWLVQVSCRLDLQPHSSDIAINTPIHRLLHNVTTDNGVLVD